MKRKKYISQSSVSMQHYSPAARLGFYLLPGTVRPPGGRARARYCFGSRRCRAVVCARKKRDRDWLMPRSRCRAHQCAVPASAARPERRDESPLQEEGRERERRATAAALRRHSVESLMGIREKCRWCDLVFLGSVWKFGGIGIGSVERNRVFFFIFQWNLRPEALLMRSRIDYNLAVTTYSIVCRMVIILWFDVIIYVQPGHLVGRWGFFNLSWCITSNYIFSRI